MIEKDKDFWKKNSVALAERLGQALERIAELEARWIPVSEIDNYAVDDLYHVPVSVPGIGVLSGVYDGEDWDCYDRGGRYFGELPVTHFYIIPAPPEDNDG